ncbi:ABC transporter permease, partial [Escherichia coli]|nr:ABC transporter permease [Escherichia coli]
LSAFLVTVARTVLGTLLGLLLTSLVAYALSHRGLMFSKTYFTIIIFAMYFSGGLIPYYVVLRSIGLLNSFAVYIVPSMLNTFFLLIAISFFREIPGELKESAHMDGAGEL